MSARDDALTTADVLDARAAVEPRRGPRAHARTFRTAFWLGWKIESNWTDPLLFAGYSIARPLSASLILIFMAFAVTRQTGGAMVSFLVVGMAFWPFAFSGVRGTVFALLEDRQQFETIRSLYTSPISYRVYLVGRCLSMLAAVSVPAMIVTLVLGVVALDVSLRFSAASVAYALVALVIGVVAVVALGLLAASLALLVSSEAWNMPEGMAAAFYLLSGAIYPVTILPSWLERVAQALPLSWWLEAMRRSLVPDAPRSFAWASEGRVLAALAMLTVAFLVAAWIVYEIAERRARRLGRLDERSGY